MKKNLEENKKKMAEKTSANELGTKNKNLKTNADGSLTLYAGAKSPGKDKENNWLSAPEGTFSLYIRAYWPDKAIVDGSWQPPSIEIDKLRSVAFGNC